MVDITMKLVFAATVRLQVLTTLEVIAQEPAVIGNKQALVLHAQTEQLMQDQGPQSVKEALQLP